MVYGYSSRTCMIRHCLKNRRLLGDPYITANGDLFFKKRHERKEDLHLFVESPCHTSCVSRASNSDSRQTAFWSSVSELWIATRKEGMITSRGRTASSLNTKEYGLALVADLKYGRPREPQAIARDKAQWKNWTPVKRTKLPWVIL